MGGNRKAVSMRIGGFAARMFKKYALLEGRVFRPFPRKVALLLSFVFRIAAIAALLYFLLVPALLVLIACALIAKMNSGTGDVYLVPQPGSSDMELLEGNEGFGLYQDGVRVG